MKTLKEFKEFIKTKPTLELVEYDIYNPLESRYQSGNHKFKNKPRRIVDTNSVGFMFEGFSEMSWPKRSELDWDGGKKFVITNECFRLTYEVK